MKTLLTAGVAIAGAALLATSAMAAKDNFNRSDLGKNWIVPYGSLYITNDELQGDTGSLGYDKKSSDDSSVTATAILNGTDLEYAAVAVGDVASGNNAFVKLQEQNGDSMFEYGGFYVGNNSGVYFFTLDSPVSSPAKMTVSLCGTVATLKIKSKEGRQTYTYDYGSGYNFGTGGGLGTYGLISFDNYKSKGAKCDAASNAKMLKPANVKDLSLRK